MALAAATVLPFMASPFAPPELLTALALLIAALAAFLGARCRALSWYLQVSGRLRWSSTVRRASPPVGVAMAVVVGLAGVRHRRRGERARLALRDLAAIRDTAAEAIVDLDPEGAITSWSRGAEQCMAMPQTRSRGAH